MGKKYRDNQASSYTRAFVGFVQMSGLRVENTFMNFSCSLATTAISYPEQKYGGLVYTIPDQVVERTGTNHASIIIVYTVL